jgi:GR25 family glycosyltransferase involved in LPS biosynthesis
MNKNIYFKYYKKKVINLLDQEPLQILDSVNINYYMIHCIEHTYRDKFIGDLILKLKKPINMFNGIYTKNVSLDNQIKYINNFDKNLKLNFKFYLQGQIGCYLSHHKIIENIMNNNLNYEYSVIFEDDVIFGKYLNNSINKIIIDLNSLNIDFDLIFLGNCSNNKGTNLINNIYYIDINNNCWGTHALLINNKNIKKIYDLNCNITNEIDTHYASLLKNKKLNGFVIYPSLCLQNSNLISTIKKN